MPFPTSKELSPTLSKLKTGGNQMVFFFRKVGELCCKHNCDLCETGTSMMIIEKEMNVPFDMPCILCQISSLGLGHTCLVLLFGIIRNYEQMTVKDHQSQEPVALFPASSLFQSMIHSGQESCQEIC